MQLRLLGPVEVDAGGRALRCGRPQQGIVLAVLMVEVGRLVPVEALVDRVWGQAPPERARRLLHSHIARIRAMLGQARAGPEETPRVARQAGGYVLEAAPDQVDLYRFRRLSGLATAPGHAVAARVALLREAMGLWRGEPLAGLSGQWVEHTRQVCYGQRLDTVLAWARAELEVGNPAAVVGPLTQELAEHPLVEPLAAALMRALAATGRAAEALGCYATTRNLLAAELGVDPGAELQAVHRAILRGDGDAPPVPATAAAPATPAQLPADVSAFTGRRTELARLDALRRDAADRSAVGIVVITGMAGVGKTALALRWAHRVRAGFPDGQLYVNLRGYDPEQPMAPAHALARFLTALGVPDAAVPPDLDDRAARFRTEAAGRRLLIVLDNAATADQVRPLLPGTASCTVVVTSRDRLGGLVAVQGARRLDLDLLPPADTHTLLRRLIGLRAETEPAAAAALADLCSRLPLALRVAAELAVSRPATSLATLAHELADQQCRLELLDVGGDPHAAVSAVFSWSLQHLPAATARAFRLLGLHPGPDVDVRAVAALTGAGLPQARRILDELLRAHLVQPASTGRYGMHDLLRAYAAWLTASVDPEPERRAATGRLLDYYLGTAAAAMDRLHPMETHHRPRVPPPATPVPELAGPDDARAWLDDERACLVAATAHAAAHGLTDHAVRLSITLYRYLDGGHNADALVLHGHAEQAARRAGDVAGRAHALRGIGTANMRFGRYRAAVEHLRRSIALFTETRDQFGLGRALCNLGNVELRQGLDEQAIDHHEQALAVFRRLDDLPGQAGTLNNLGATYARLGRYRRSAELFGQALALHRTMRQGRADGTVGDRYGQAHTLDNLGAALTRLGEPDRATGCYEEALHLFREIGDRDGEACVLNGLGETAHTAGRADEAVAYHTTAWAITTDIGARDQQARADLGLGHAWLALGDRRRARHHYGQALTVYAALESPEVADVRARFDALAPPA